MADNAKKNDGGGVSGWVIALIIIIVLGLGAAASWIIFTRIRARRLGLPPPSLNPFSRSAGSSNYPSPAPTGVIGWITDKFRGLTNKRTAGGAYEGTSSGGRRGRGFGPLDPDEAWDSRVEHEADAYGPGGYYEEQELDLHARTSYGGGSYENQTLGPGSNDNNRRGRSRERELDERYDEHAGKKPAQDPFGDHAEPSNLPLRGVSPRPMDTHHASHASLDGKAGSPTERKSVFREDMR